jgi:hypothetical protein
VEWSARNSQETRGGVEPLLDNLTNQAAGWEITQVKRALVRMKVKIGFH